MHDRPLALLDAPSELELLVAREERSRREPAEVERSIAASGPDRRATAKRAERTTSPNTRLVVRASLLSSRFAGVHVRVAHFPCAMILVPTGAPHAPPADGHHNHAWRGREVAPGHSRGGGRVRSSVLLRLAAR